MKPEDSDWRVGWQGNILVAMKQYTVSDGKVVLTLQEAEEGGYVVTSPLDPQLITEAETVKEAFENARDAMAALAVSRRKLIKKLAGVKAWIEGLSKGTFDPTAVSSTITEVVMTFGWIREHNHTHLCRDIQLSRGQPPGGFAGSWE
jgi:antitoxin HicB